MNWNWNLLSKSELYWKRETPAYDRVRQHQFSHQIHWKILTHLPAIFTYSLKHTHTETLSLSKDCLNCVSHCCTGFLIRPFNTPRTGFLYGNVLVLKNRTAMEWNVSSTWPAKKPHINSTSKRLNGI